MSDACKATRGNLRCERPIHDDPRHSMRTRTYLRVRGAVRVVVLGTAVTLALIVGALDSPMLH